ncbi:hypothetical protein H8N03_25780 [Ramlibacter sp. USB13]|uniref:Uncharacterized protein n=1 Tax=Ramlibacter cellulosilyticus TaxID=2764187 RepID=A0A923MX84_9BURK|nr:hypothetical protein [Ramlibacter cellulosilyticus]MBC5786374.1 hypothetical protein [Ramlibacter cellulosilyticus]
MNQPQLFRRVEERTFFAHHMLLHAAEMEIGDAEASEVGRFNKCLAAMVMTALAVEGLVNAVGSRVAEDYPAFEHLRPLEKLDFLVRALEIVRDQANEPWTTLQFLGGFRNDIAHPKPELVVKESILPEVGLAKTAFDTPLSALEREITVGNVKRAFAAVRALKGLLTDAMPEHARFGIYGDMWHGSTSPHEI